MRLYTGTAWTAAYVSGAGVLLISNNLSDLSSVSTARTNLGLATVAASGAYADLTGKPTAVSAFSNDAGYLTSFTESDPTVPSHVKAITTTKISNWDTAFSWGNHASAGYLTGITSGQVTTALGYTPADATLALLKADNLSGLANAVTARTNLGIGNVENKNSATIRSEITSSNVTTALGFTPYNATNPSGYISGITSGMVTTALGFTPYNATNPAGYITGITSGNVTTALGYTPANKAGDTFTGLVTVSGTGLSAAVRLSNTSGGRDWRVMQKDDGRFVITDETAGAERLAITSGGAVTALTDIRAPIFYDSNNTGYYVDPNSTSNLRGLTLTDGSPAMTFSSTTSGRSAAFGMTDAYNMYLNAPSGGLLYLSNFSAPIFYDSSNSGYYCDPASTSNFNVLNVQQNNSTAGGGISFNGAGNAFIRGTNVDNAVANGANLQLQSWFGIGFGPSISGQPIPIGENAVYINARNGDLTARGNITAYSDIRVKKDVETIGGALDLVSKMRGVRYTHIHSGWRGVGVIAQELQKVVPEVVQRENDENGALSVAYGNLVGVLIEAIKELRDEVETLKGKSQ